MRSTIADFLLTGEAARMLDRTPDTVRGLERMGRLHAMRVGGIRLYSRQEVEEFLRLREGRGVRLGGRRLVEASEESLATGRAARQKARRQKDRSVDPKQA